MNTRDFIAFLNAWAQGEPSADLNGDGSIDGDDFTIYLDAFLNDRL